MDKTHFLEVRLIELESRCALQDELLVSLNDTIVKMQDTLDLQQAQLRWLYQQQQQQGNDTKPYSVLDECPPHY